MPASSSVRDVWVLMCRDVRIGTTNRHHPFITPGKGTVIINAKRAVFLFHTVCQYYWWSSQQHNLLFLLLTGTDNTFKTLDMTVLLNALVLLTCWLILVSIRYHLHVVYFISFITKKWLTCLQPCLGKFGKLQLDRYVTTARKLNLVSRLEVDRNLTSSSTWTQ